MKSVSELHFRVCDHGLFMNIARRLARDAAKVTYWTPSEKDFPTLRDCLGDGFDDIERVSSMWTEKDSVDCWVFPDVGFSEEQNELLSQGKKVWGARYGDILEQARGVFLSALKETGLPVPEYTRVQGITKLKEHLHDKEDRWIKISRYRGDFETFHWRSWEEDENRLNYYAVQFGPFREQILFYVFNPIETDIEDGCDSWCINGAYPKLVIHGMECKDRAYLGAWQKYSDLPEEVRKVSDAFAPVLKEYGYQSFFSTEIRITKARESFFIDPTCRAGSPPHQVMTEMIGNYAEVIWGGANGEMVEPYPAANFGAQAMVYLKRELKEWGAMRVTDELDRWFKPTGCVRLKDHLWFPPDPSSPQGEVGWLTGIGDLPDEPIRHLQHNIKLLPDGTSCDVKELATLIEEVNKAESAGMNFTKEPMPDPSIVLDEK